MKKRCKIPKIIEIKTWSYNCRREKMNKTKVFKEIGYSINFSQLLIFG